MNMQEKNEDFLDKSGKFTRKKNQTSSGITK